MNMTVLKDYINLGISLVLFGAFLSVILLLVQGSNSIISIKDDRETFTESLKVNRNLLIYDDYDVSRDDLLLAAKEYTKVYPILIQSKLTNKDKQDDNEVYSMNYDEHEGDIYLDDKSSDTEWNIKNLENRLTNNLESDYVNQSGISLEDITYHARIEYYGNSTDIKQLTFTLNTPDPDEVQN